MVDYSTEDVPFREGTFGEAGSVVPIPTPGFPLLALSLVLLQILTSYLVIPKRKPPTSPLGGSRLRHWLCPSLKRPSLCRRASKPLLRAPLSVVLRTNPTLAPVRNGVKALACDIYPRCCVGYICPGCYGDVRRSPLYTPRVHQQRFGVVLALLLGDASQGLWVADVDATLPQLHDPFALEPPQCPVHRHALRPYHGAQFLVSVGGR